MEFFFGLIIGFLFTPVGLIGLLLFSVFCSAKESAFWSTVFGGTFIAGVLYLTATPLIYVAYLAPVYLVLGLLWSMWRYKRYVTKKVKTMVDISPASRKYLLASIHPKQMLGSIVGWTITWPFSVVGSAIEDFIVAIEHIINNWLGGIYSAIFKQAEHVAQTLDKEQKENENI